MRPLAAGLTAAAIGLMISPARGVPPDAAQAPDFIVTAAPVYEPLAELSGQERFSKGAQLLLVHSGNTEPLVNGFAASADANVSFDGQTVLFSGRRSAGDPWQIWELNLKDRSVRKVTATATGAERPFYLPGGRLVWAQRTAAGFQLQSSDDGRPIPKLLIQRRVRGYCRSRARERTHFRRTCCMMGGFCLKPVFRWERKIPRPG